MICAGCADWKPGMDIGELKMPTAEQGEALLKARLERAQKAKNLFDETGEVIYQPLVDPKAADPDTGALAGLPGPVVWAWYGPWTLKGFENRYAIMSDLDHFDYSTVSGVSKLNKPALIIHGDNCMNAAAAKRHYDSIPTKNKNLFGITNFHIFNITINLIALTKMLEISAHGLLISKKILLDRHRQIHTNDKYDHVTALFFSLHIHTLNKISLKSPHSATTVRHGAFNLREGLEAPINTPLCVQITSFTP